jgi:hypothetical protein
MKRWTERARRLKTELYALYLAARHPQTPWYAKFVVAGFVAYAVTPVLAGCRARAHDRISLSPRKSTLVVVVALWAALGVAGIALYI